MATGVTAISQEEANYLRAVHLCYVIAREAVGSHFDSIHPDLITDLENEKEYLNKKNVLGFHRKTVYPPEGHSPPKSTDFDISLLFLLLQKMENKLDDSNKSHIQKIKDSRNELAFSTDGKLQTPKFEEIWKDLETIFEASILSNNNKSEVVSGDISLDEPMDTSSTTSNFDENANTVKEYYSTDTQTTYGLVVNEVKNSYAMELEGLQRCLRKVLDEEDLGISHLVTDKKKYMREAHPDITHWFDCWHVAKGNYKKLETLGKNKAKRCQIIGLWARSIRNHTYWCAMSGNGNEQMVYEKWLSILNHMCNIHEDHGSKFTRCQHGEIDDRDWIKKGSRAYEELEKVIKGRLLLKDVWKISPAEQTSGIEAFHKVLCYFAPKLVHFFHAQMEARLQLAALHFNENSCRKQQVNQKCEAMFSVSYPKSRKGEVLQKK